MNHERVRGLFITGVDTHVGKTYVGALIARALAARGRRVGVYKPAASGCRASAEGLVADDAVALWRAAGSPGELERVCPQFFAAPLAPPLAARSEGRRLDPVLLRTGLRYWLARSEVVVVEGAGGLLSPLGEEESAADLAHDFGFPLVVVAANRLGAINQSLQTVFTAAHYRGGLPLAGIVLNRIDPNEDESVATNREELTRRSPVPVLAEAAYRAESFDRQVDWFSLAGEGKAGFFGG